MKQVFVVALLAFVASGCMLNTGPDGVTRRVPAPQVGANVQVLDLCGGEPGVLHGTHGYALTGVRTLPGRSFWVALPTDDGLRTHSVGLTYVATWQGRPGGAVSQAFPVSHYQGSQRYQWVLVPPGQSWPGGGSNIYVSQCPVPDTRRAW